MSYRFIGVFVERPEKTIEELEELFDGYAREIKVPFVGTIISFKKLDSGERLEEGGSIKIRVLEKSQQLPQSRIAYIEYETFGGLLEFVGGFACRDGELLENSDRCTEDDDQPDGNDLFMALQEFVGAKSSRVNFEPFERGYFPNT